MANINLTSLSAERLREVISYDPATGIFTRRVSVGRRRSKVGDVAGSVTWNGYAIICVDSLQYRAHRLAWLYVYGKWPNADIDHINRNRIDNRIANLREATRGQNMQNAGLQKNNMSGIRGVYWDNVKQKWTANIQHNHRTIYLGRFDRIDDATSARRAAEKHFFTHSQ